MSTLLKELVQVDPMIAVDSVTEFRATLVAISIRMQEESCSGNSLQAWWQWLEDEGYDRDNFATVLSKIGTARLGDQAFAALLSFCRTSEASADGIPHLLEHLHSHHPQLAAELETLEDLALVEEEQLLSTAGGMSKGGRDALISVAAVAGTAVVGVVGYKLHRGIQRWALARAERVREAAQTDARELEHRAERATSEEHRQQVYDAVQKVWDNRKNISEYTAQDIDSRAGALLVEHVNRFKNSFAKYIESRVEIAIRNREEYQQKLTEYAESKEHDYEDHLLNIRTKAKQKLEQELAPEFEKEGWFQEAVHNEFELHSGLYKEEATRAVKTKYRDLVRQEVLEAKAFAENEFHQAVGIAEEDVFSQVKVMENVLAMEAEAAVEQAEREGEAIVRDSEEDVDSLL